MFVKGLSRGFAPCCSSGSGIASGQTMPTVRRIESVPLELTMPERYQVAEILEPIRRVTLIAPADGFVRSMESRWAPRSASCKKSPSSTATRRRPG